MPTTTRTRPSLLTALCSPHTACLTRSSRRFFGSFPLSSFDYDNNVQLHPAVALSQRSVSARSVWVRRQSMTAGAGADGDLFLASLSLSVFRFVSCPPSLLSRPITTTFSPPPSRRSSLSPLTLRTAALCHFLHYAGHENIDMRSAPHSVPQGCTTSVIARQHRRPYAASRFPRPFF